jgi:hypothetical protein
MTGMAVPSRTFNLMAAGKPILAIVSEESEVAQIIHEHDIGWVVEADKPEQTIAAIRAAMNGGDLLTEMGSRARMAAETRFRPEKILKDFDETIVGLIGPAIPGNLAEANTRDQEPLSAVPPSNSRSNEPLNLTPRGQRCSKSL